MLHCCFISSQNMVFNHLLLSGSSVKLSPSLKRGRYFHFVNIFVFINLSLCIFDFIGAGFCGVLTSQNITFSQIWQNIKLCNLQKISTCSNQLSPTENIFMMKYALLSSFLSSKTTTQKRFKQTSIVEPSTQHSVTNCRCNSQNLSTFRFHEIEGKTIMKTKNFGSHQWPIQLDLDC